MLNKKFISVLVVLVLLVAAFWFFAPKKPYNTQQVADDSLASIKNKGVLVVGTYPKLHPLTFYDAAGDFTGHDLELIIELAKRLDLEVEFREIFFGDLFDAVNTGEVDVAISGITITAERSENVFFTAPYFDAGQVITVFADNDDIKGPEDISDKKVGAMEGTTGEIAAARYVDDANLMRFKHREDAVESLLRGELDAIVEDYVGASAVVKENERLKLVGDPFTEEFYGIITKKGNDALVQAINQELKKMKTDGTLLELRSKWL